MPNLAPYSGSIELMRKYGPERVVDELINNFESICLRSYRDRVFEQTKYPAFMHFTIMLSSVQDWAFHVIWDHLTAVALDTVAEQTDIPIDDLYTMQDERVERIVEHLYNMLELNLNGNYYQAVRDVLDHYKCTYKALHEEFEKDQYEFMMYSVNGPALTHYNAAQSSFFDKPLVHRVDPFWGHGLFNEEEEE